MKELVINGFILAHLLPTGLPEDVEDAIYTLNNQEEPRNKYEWWFLCAALCFVISLFTPFLSVVLLAALVTFVLWFFWVRRNDVKFQAKKIFENIKTDNTEFNRTFSIEKPLGDPQKDLVEPAQARLIISAKNILHHQKSLPTIVPETNRGYVENFIKEEEVRFKDDFDLAKRCLGPVLDFENRGITVFYDIAMGNNPVVLSKKDGSK